MAKKRYSGKQKQIEEAALEVFIELGIENLTLESVSEKLGYTKQAIYYYFKNKEELINSFCLNILIAARDEVLEICSEDKDPETMLIDLIRYYVEGTCSKQGFFALHNSLKQVLSQIKNDDIKQEMFFMMRQILDSMNSIIKNGIKKRVFRDEEPDEMAATVFCLLGGIVSITEVGALTKISIERKVKLITDIIIKGIKT